MRLESIQIDHFRGIEHLDLRFNPHFTLLVGDNASGKTSILSAISVALGIWHHSKLIGGPRQWRNIMDHELREVPTGSEGGERIFSAPGEAQITAKGSIGERPHHGWTRFKSRKGSPTADVWMKEISEDIKNVVAARQEQKELLPLLASYGAGRAWLPSNERATADLSGDLKSRLGDGYVDCLRERVRVKDIMRWFVLEAAARDEKGRFRAGFHAVKLALLRGIPGIDDLCYDHDKREIIISIKGRSQPFSRLSDGQRTMAATVADMAIRAYQLNRFLVDRHPGDPQAAAEEVLRETHGVVLIDEVDVHLHPAWQRTVVRNLTDTFPKVQFICSTHSAQVLGEVPAERVWILDGKEPRHPPVSYADSNWVLEHHMGTRVPSRNVEVKNLLETADNEMDEGDLDDARQLLEKARAKMGGADGELTRLESSLETLDALNREDDR